MALANLNEPNCWFRRTDVVAGDKSSSDEIVGCSCCCC